MGRNTHGLARIDSAEETIIASATAPDQVAQDGAGRNSPFTEALIRRIKEPGLEIGTMFRRVRSDVYEMTNGRQRPEVSISLLTDYFLIPVENEVRASRPSKHRVASAGASRPSKHRVASAAREEEPVSRPLRRRNPQPVAPAPRLTKILETGYSLLKDIGGEERGYGLYSYAILVNDNDRSAKFLGHLFGDGHSTIPPVEEMAAPPSQTNALYIPLKRNKAKEWSNGLKLGTEAALRAAYAKKFYDYKMSRTLLNHLCVSPVIEIKSVCEGDLSSGPYIFSYATPASKVSPVPPPFLFMDLSDVHERAFPEFIAAFKAQVKREDISDRAKIDTLRLKVLNIVLTTADWLVPVKKAVADIVYSPAGQAEKDKK